MYHLYSLSSFICMQGSGREQFICHMKADWRVIAKWACSSHGAIYSSCLLVCFRKCQLAACTLVGVSPCLCVCATRCRAVVQQFAVNHMQYIFQRKTKDILTRYRLRSVSHGWTSCLMLRSSIRLIQFCWHCELHLSKKYVMSIKINYIRDIWLPNKAKWLPLFLAV